MLKKLRKNSAKKLCKKSPLTKRPKLIKKTTNLPLNQITSPRSPPHITSRSRQKEQDLETVIKSHMDFKKHPELAKIDYKSWRARTSHKKISYLDTLYARQLARHFDESADSASSSRINLQNLTKTLEKALNSQSPTANTYISPRGSTRMNTRLTNTGDLSYKFFSKSVFTNNELNEASENLDKLRAKLLRNK